MDRETIQRVKNQLQSICKSEGINLTEIIVFGSRIKGDYTDRSDIDILLISKDFEGQKWYKRPGVFYRYWDYKNLPEPEIICYTPQEFERKKNEIGIVAEALKEGIEITP